MAKVMGTVKSIIGEATATAPDGTVRKLQVGDQVFTDDVISTSATGSVQIALAGGKTLECGNDTSIAMNDYVIGSDVNVALAATPVTPPAATDVASLQAAIASGADPSQVAAATAAGGAPGAGGGAEGGGGRSIVVLEQGNSAQVVNAGFSTEGAGISFPTPEFELLPEEGQPVVSVTVEVEVEIDPENPPPDGSGGIINVSGNTVDVLEGTNGGNLTPVTFNIVLSAASDEDVQVTYTIMAGTAGVPEDFTAILTDTVTIPAGETSFPVTVYIEQDHLVEGTETFNIVLSDAVGAVINPDSDTVFVNIIDDDARPVVNDDSNWVQEDGEKQVAEGNVLQSQGHPDDPSESLSFADVADTDSNTEEVLAVTSVNGSGANVGVAIEGTYGTLTLNADGSYTYTLTNSDPAVQGLGPQDSLTDSFTYTITDGYNGSLESATLTITIFGGADGPIVQLPDPVRVSEEGLDGGIPDNSGSSDQTNSTTASGQIIASDTDGDALTFTLNEPTGTLFSNGVEIVWSGDGTDTLIGTAGESTIITITIDSDGNYDVELSGPVDHGNTAEEDQLTINVGVSVSDGSETTNTTMRVVVEDDSPVVTAQAAQADALQVDESALGTDATVDFSSLFTSNAGADGEESTVYTLGINAGSTGLLDSATGEAVTLQLVGGVVQGVISGGVVVFEVSVDADGNVTLDQQRAVRHDPNSGPDQETSLAQANLITLTATTTDQDGDSDSATVNLGNAISFRDDAPSINLADVQTPSLTVDETVLETNDSADFSGVFSSEFGADGAGSVGYALVIVGGNGTDSGVVDTATGDAVRLYKVGGVIEGRNDEGDVVFLVTVDANGVVTLDQMRAVIHSVGSNPDTSDPVSLDAGVLTLRATVTDADGDSDTASIDLGSNLTFLDDGPSISITAGDTSVVEGGTVSNGEWTVDEGADGGVVKIVFGGEEYDLDEAIDTGKGTLTVNSDFTWEFVSDDNLNNPSGVNLSFQVKVTDADGDFDTDSHTITITDGAGPVGGDVVALSVDEDDLPEGSDPAPKDSLSDSDGLDFSAGSDNIASIVFGTTDGISVSGIEGGTTITWVASNGGRTLTGSIGGTEVIKLDLTGATSVAAGGNGTTTVTATLLADFPHEDGPDADSLTITGIVVVATDTDGDSATGTVSVAVVDDEPIVTATGGTIENDIGETLTGLLPYDMNADGLGTLTLANPIVTSNDQPLALTSNGHAVVYQLTDENGDGVQELKAYADVDGNGFDEGDTLVFSLTATGGAEGSYTLTMHDVVDLPVPTIELSFAGITASGPVDEINVGNKLLISTVDAVADDLNSNQGFIGINNNVMNGPQGPNDGELIRYEFGTVTGVPGPGDFDITHEDVNDVQLSIFDVGSGTDSFDWTAYKDGVEVGTGSVSFDLGDDQLTPAIHVDGGYDTLILDVTGGDFKVGGVTYTELGDAQDVNLNIGFTGTDSDGDATSGSIDVTITAGDGAVDQAVQTLLNQDNI